MQPTRTEAIKRFLIEKTHPDLANLYRYEMEVQVNVAQHGGQRESKEFKGRQWMAWTDGIESWKSFRIPYNAATEPEYKDVPMTFNLEKYVEGIGMTGWDWVNRRSKWVAFDFDAIAGHSDKHNIKLSSDELAKVQEAAQAIDWVTVRRSTSGKGLHLYVMLPDVPTANHMEHAALGRAILGQMVALTGFAFNTRVDICGGNMWVWHQKMINTEGLSLLKPGFQIPESEIPPNWRDHLKVVTGKRKKIGVGSEDIVEKTIEDLADQRAHVKLDDDHRRLIDFLKDEFPGRYWWDTDHHMLVAHTACLKKAHESLQLKGIYETSTTESSEINCFCFPMRRGGWSVRRYSKGVREASTWDQDGSGWTRCYLNREPDLATAARACEGIEDPKGGFVFQFAEQAVKAALMLGVTVDVPHQALMRRCLLKEHKDGRLIIILDKNDQQDHGLNFQGWLPDKKSWTRIYNAQISKADAEIEMTNFDDMIRHLISEAMKDAGWVIKSGDEWHEEPLSNISLALNSQGLSPKEVKQIEGNSVMQCWKLVNRPFQPEYPGARTWNRNSAQFAFPPNLTGETLVYPTWTKILDHCGKSLNDAISQHQWCIDNGIRTGGDYLKIWLASMFQHPLEPLPYLFFYGPQNTGKSTFHLAVQRLLKDGNGYKRADNALTSNFNAELEGGILCVIEETNMKKDKKAYEKIRDLVTSPQISIHPKGFTPYLVPNSTHWVQCANDFDACPAFAGDTRITMILVEPFTERIDKHTLYSLLDKEAPDFLGELLRLELPTSNDRLFVPVINTSDKQILEDSNKSMLEIFIQEQCHHVPGNMVMFSDFYERFIQWCPRDEAHMWSKIKVGREIPLPYVKGRKSGSGQFHVGNLSWDGSEKPGKRLALSGDILREVMV